jgi:hypothetical protein
MIIRAKTYKRWLKANLGGGYLKDLAEQGALGGFPGLSYYRDTCKLYAKFREEIWDKLSEMAENQGCANTWEMIAGFSLAGWENARQAENLLVWAVAEEYAGEMTGTPDVAGEEDDPAADALANHEVMEHRRGIEARLKGLGASAVFQKDLTGAPGEYLGDEDDPAADALINHEVMEGGRP